MDTGTLLLGRRTWQKFTGIWPARSDDFSTQMKRMHKLVASESLERVDAWENSELLNGDPVDEVKKRKGTQDLIVVGSDSLVQRLMQHDLVDEYRDHGIDTHRTPGRPGARQQGRRHQCDRHDAEGRRARGFRRIQDC